MERNRQETANAKIIGSINTVLAGITALPLPSKWWRLQGLPLRYASLGNGLAIRTLPKMAMRPCAKRYTCQPFAL